MKRLVTFLHAILFSISFVLIAPVCGNAQNKKAKANRKVSSRVGASKKQGVKKILYGQASYYHQKFHGRKTASGHVFNQQKLTAACNVLPIGTRVRVTNLRNKKSVVVTVNDRLNKKTKRLIDLTFRAANTLGFIKRGLTRVKIEVL